MGPGIAAKLVELFTVVQGLPGTEWYVDDGDRAMYSRPHYVAFEKGRGACPGDAAEALIRAPDGSDGRGAHGDGDRGVFRTVVEILNILAQLRPLLSTPALQIMLCALAERERQQAPAPDGEGWDAAHDDSHPLGELAVAAAFYAMAASGHVAFNTTGRPPALELQRPGTKGFTSFGFPWEAQRFKPKHAQRNVEIAMALLAAHSEAVSRDDRRKAAEALPDKPYQDMVRLVLSATGIDDSKLGPSAINDAIKALKLHHVNQ